MSNRLLKDERRAVYQTLMEMDCIPAGMELFPATDEEQWLFIQKIIDDSDYYVLILGGRYGSMTADGVSYTEKEFDYAISKGVKVVALIHGEPGKLPVEKSEMDPAVREKLEAFRNKAATGRLVRFWTNSSELSALVALSLPKTMKMFPAVGWVRADKATGSAELLAQINELRIANDKLKAELEAAKTADVVFSDKIASGDDLFYVKFEKCKEFNEYGRGRDVWEAPISYDRIFVEFGHKLFEGIGPSSGRNYFEDIIKYYFQYRDIEIREACYFSLLLQFETLGLISIESNKYARLTSKGRAHLSKLLVARKPSVSSPDPHAALQDQS